MFDLDQANPAPSGHWSDYVRGVCIEFEKHGHRLRGANLVIDGEVPVGSGLSSSAALEVATALAVRGNSLLELGLTETALLCQQAENQFVGARTGIMDQFVACYGRADHALLLDCRSLEMNYAPVPDRVKLVICDTGVRHALAEGEYNLRRAQCEAGVASLAKVLPDVRSLRDITLTQLTEYGSTLDTVIYRRCRHVITENIRVLDAAKALERADLAEFGRLMIESHRSLTRRLRGELRGTQHHGGTRARSSSRRTRRLRRENDRGWIRRLYDQPG